jgi:brefeldin A-resistance guanine nucleotide exchange factor 1
MQINKVAILVIVATGPLLSLISIHSFYIIEGTAAGIHSLSIQLLDLMHTLHTRAASIYKSWAEEEQSYQDPNDSVDAGINALWLKCWCPLLQGNVKI